MTTIGRIREVVRYPVKSMAGSPAAAAYLGFHGFAGDRRFAFRRTSDGGAFPFLTAGRFPALLTYQPIGADESAVEPLPTHVRTPGGAEVELRGDELRRDIASRSGHEVDLLHFRNGIFDDGLVSLITLSTIAAIGQEAGLEMDRRRMRANVYIDSEDTAAFREDSWVGRTIVLGDGDEAPAVVVTSRDERCAMVNFDPDSAEQDPRVMKAIVRMNDNYAGAYATVVRAGTVRAGDVVRIV